MLRQILRKGNLFSVPTIGRIKHPIARQIASREESRRAQGNFVFPRVPRKHFSLRR